MATKTLSNGTKVSYDKSTGTFNVGGKTYTNKNDAANAIRNTGYTSNNKKNSGSNFVDVSVLHDQHMGKSNEDIASKWGGPNATVNSTGGQKVLQALAKNNKVYGTGGYTNYDSNTGLYSKPSTSTTSTAADPASQYSDASYTNYTNAFNRFKEQGMDEATARSQASKLLENENLIKNKTDEEIAAETQKNDDEEINYEDPVGDVMGGEGEESSGEPEEPNANEQTIWEEEGFDNIGDYIDYSINKGINDYIKDWESKNTQTNVIKETVPEERDDTFDFNTYYNRNVADQTPYESGESKMSNQEGLTWSSKYQDDTTSALQDLGLLTPNEQAAEEIPNTEEQPSEVKTYNTGEEVIQDFENAIEGMGQEGGLNKENLLRTYRDYRNKLQDMQNNGQISKEEFAQFFEQLKNNETLRNALQDNK